MSNLVAVNCGHMQMLRASDVYNMATIEQAMHEQRSIEVLVYIPEHGEDRIIVIAGLHLAKDGWNVQHIEGTILEPEGEVRAILYDNEAEADPLNLR